VIEESKEEEEAVAAKPDKKSKKSRRDRSLNFDDGFSIKPSERGDKKDRKKSKHAD